MSSQNYSHSARQRLPIDMVDKGYEWVRDKIFEARDKGLEGQRLIQYLNKRYNEGIEVGGAT